MGQDPVIVGEQWADFQVDPNKFEANREDVVFWPLIDIMKAVANAATVALGGNKLRGANGSNPNAVPASKSRDNLTRPDGWTIRIGSKSSGKEAHWMNMAATGEFKKEDLEPKVTDVSTSVNFRLRMRYSVLYVSRIITRCCGVCSIVWWTMLAARQSQSPYAQWIPSRDLPHVSLHPCYITEDLSPISQNCSWNSSHRGYAQ